MDYAPDSLEARLLREDPDAVGTIARWVSIALTDLRYWGLRSEWLDLHQETMLRIVASLRSGRFRADSDLRSYVQAVARHTVWHAVRDRRRARPSAGTFPLVRREAHALAVEDAMLRRLTARKALSLLPGDCRALVEAYYFAELGYDEIATSLSVPTGTVKSRLFRCLERLRVLLKETRESPPGTRKGTAAVPRGTVSKSRKEPTRQPPS